MWSGEHWYQGTCDAVFQNLHLVTLFDADRICIFAADHIYKMDVEQMLAFHVENGADATVAANVVPKAEASQFGCIHTDEKGRIIGFVEKPADPPEIPGKPGYSYVSMGNYIFEREILEEAVIEDARDPSSNHDFGKNVLPALWGKCKVFAYDFSTNKLPGKDRPYWKDVGTIKAYWEAHMDLCHPDSDMTLFNPKWRIRTVSFADPPAYSYPSGGQQCSVIGTLRAEGSRVLGAVVHRSILARNTLINPGAVLKECIIGQGVIIGENCKLRRVIVDAHNKIPPDTIIGYDLDEDRKKYHVDETSGVVVIGMPVMQLRKDIEIPIPPILER
jgi:glucose-1-phosphate adenylyltransferase